MGRFLGLLAWRNPDGAAPSSTDVLPAPKSEAVDVQGTRWRGASRSLRSLLNWIPGIGSATSDLPREEQRTLRARSRDAMRSHMLGRAALLRCRTNIVGTGLMCRPNVDADALGLTPDEAEALNQQLRQHYEAWAEDPQECDWEGAFDFYGLQGLALLSAMMSGDVFALTPIQQRVGGAFDLKCQLIEADRISNPNDGVNTETLHDGIALDNGVPVGCWVRSTHPGDTLTTTVPRWQYYAFYGATTGRRRVIQIWNDKERPGQLRGAPYLAPILEPLKQLDRYGGAELTAAVLSAMLTVFIERDKELAGEDGSQVGPLGTPDAAGNVHLGNGAVVDLLPGEKATVVDPSRPNANFDPFFVAVVKQIGAALELPLDELLLHYQSSYSAARAAMLQAWRFYMTRRWALTQQFCQPFYGLLLDELVATGRVLLPGYADPMRRRAYTRAIWIGPARGAMDEYKEAQAAGKRIEIGVSNEAIECAAMLGEDWRSVRQQREQELMHLRHSEALSTAQYGEAARAGVITPNEDDELYFRDYFGLPGINQNVSNEWKRGDGVRKPITLQAEDQRPASAPKSNQNSDEPSP